MFFVSIITVGKKCCFDQEKVLKVEAEGQEFARFLGSLEKSIRTRKGRNHFGNIMIF